jgi:hypothetical protein
MIQEKARQLVKDAQQKGKDMEVRWKDAEFQIQQEYGKAQRTIQVLFYRATTTCDNFYERINDAFQCVHNFVTTTVDEKAVALKKRCVIVNDWNIGVMRKRSKIEVQARGNPIQSYEAKFPGKSATCKPFLEVNLRPFRDRFNEQLPPQQRRIGNDLNESGSGGEQNDDDDDDDDDDDEYENVSINEYWHAPEMARESLDGEREGDDEDDMYENVSSSKYLYAQKIARKTWPVQIENEVVVRKKPKDCSFFGGERRQETLHRLIGVFKRNLGDLNLSE